MRNKTTGRTRELKEAIVNSFMLRPPVKSGLSGFSQTDWDSALWWLDISGMAIYLLDRIRQTTAEDIPEAILDQLERRLKRNRIRMKSLGQESRTLAAWFDGGRLPYVLLKGITLTPDSVSDSALRCQADLDFLLPKRNLGQAIHYVKRLGYRLYAKSGNTLEFRAGEAGLPDLADLYSAKAQRALELHLVAEESNLLTRRVSRVFDGACINALSPPDILVQQALHLLKHLCGEHTRLSWVLEFWRHANSRSEDFDFWNRAERIAAEEMNADLAMGIAFWVSETMFGRTQITIPRQWQTQTLPSRVRLWLELYAREVLLQDSIGSKLYALLRNEVPCCPEEARRTHKILFPLYLPGRLTAARPHESFAERFTRYRVEAAFFLRRLNFHFTEGIRFGFEALRWRKATLRCGQ